jgi:hypothetical protein
MYERFISSSMLTGILFGVGVVIEKAGADLKVGPYR